MVCASRVKEANMSDTLSAAISGAIVGATLGAPLRGNNSFRRLNYYEPIPARMCPTPGLDAWLVWAKHVKVGEAPEAVCQSLRECWRYEVHESAFGMANLERGFDAPLSGSFQNPLAEGAEAFGRTAAWGILFHGNSDLACQYAYYDASFDHADEGVWTAVALARMACEARPGIRIEQLLKCALEVLPKESQAIAVLSAVLKSVNDGEAIETLYARLPLICDTQDPHSALINFAFVLIGLLHGKGQFGPSILATAGCGGSSDSTTLVTGLIVAALNPDISSEWTDPLGDTYVCGSGLTRIELPANLTSFVEWIRSASIEPIAQPTLPLDEPVPAIQVEPIGALPVSEPLATTLGSESIHSEPVSAVAQQTPAVSVEDPGAEIPQEAGPVIQAVGTAPTPRDLEPALAELEKQVATSTSELSDLVRELISQPNCESTTVFLGIRLSVRYLTGPSVAAGESTQIVVTIGSADGNEHVIEPALTGPEGWQVAEKFTSFRVRPGENSSFPVVCQVPKDADTSKPCYLLLKLNSTTVRIPLVWKQSWYWVGPFVNHDGMGFDKVNRCEDIFRTSETFNGRSDLPVKWTKQDQAGTIFDLESLFKTGAGVIYLYGRVRLPESGKVRIVAVAPIGVQVKVNNCLEVKYHDTHVPIPRAIQPYVGEFQSSGELEVLVKFMRNREPVGPLVLYFLNAEGKVLTPVLSASMPA